MQFAKETLRVALGLTVSFGLMTAALVVSQGSLAEDARALVPRQPPVHHINDDPTDFFPIARFRVTTNAGMGREAEGTIGTEFFFDARQSNDPEGTALKYRWDLDGDGQAETDWFTEPTITRTYWELGQKTIKLIVRDEFGNMDHTVQDIKIVSNTRPTGFFTVEPEQGSPAQKFRFDATESFDDQYKQNRLQYRWDFDGDGVYDTDWVSREIIEHTYGYGYAGIYTVTLQVKDPENGRHTYSREIEILENTIPVAVIEVDPKVGTFGTIFKFSGEKSFDDETEFRDLDFRWDTDYNGPNDIIYDSFFSGGNYRKSIRFDDDSQRVGRQKVRMQVQDEDGKIGTAIAEINLHWASPYLEYFNNENIIFTKYDRNFNPDTPVPRGEVIQMIMKTLGVKKFNISYEQFFSDVPMNQPQAEYIAEAYRRGIVEGYPDGTFRPDGQISRAETLSMILRAFNIRTLRGGFQFYADVPMHEWYFPYVDTGTVHELVSGYDNGRFGPHDPITFGEISKILFQASRMDDAS